MKTPSLVTLVNWSLAAAGVVCLTAGTVRMVFGDVGAGGAGIAAGMLLLLASTIDRFEFLRGLGIEAKTRELRKTIDAADEIVQQMKRLAEVVCGRLIQLSARAGRFGSATPPDEGLELSRSVKAILEGVGADPSVIRETLAPWAQFAALDIARWIVSQVGLGTNQVLHQRQQVLDSYPQPVRVDDPAWNRALAERNEVSTYLSTLPDLMILCPLPALSAALRKFAGEMPPFVLSAIKQQVHDEVDRWLPEFEYLDRHLEFKTREIWIERIHKIHMGQ